MKRVISSIFMIRFDVSCGKDALEGMLTQKFVCRTLLGMALLKDNRTALTTIRTNSCIMYQAYKSQYWMWLMQQYSQQRYKVIYK